MIIGGLKMSDVLTFREVKDKVYNAQQTLKNADNLANEIASFLDGRLRIVSPWKLQKLKRELQQFNAKTGEWKI